MKVISLVTLFAILSITQFCLYAQPPKAPSQAVTETFFGKQVTDPYRNLENLNDTNVMNWYKTQAAYTASQLQKIPKREAIFKELEEEDAKYHYTITLRPATLPAWRANNIFFVKILKDEPTHKLYVRSAGSIVDELIFDPNKDNKTNILNVITGFRVNYKGSLISIVVIQQGNEVGQMLIFDIQQKKVIETIDRVWEPADWINNDIFTYTQLPSADVHESGFLLNNVAKKHIVGSNPVNDPVLLSPTHDPLIMTDSSYYPWVYTPHQNARYIIAQLAGPEQFNEVYLARFDPKSNAVLKWYPFIKKEDQITRYMLQGEKAFALSVKDNKRGKILMTSAMTPDWKHAKTIAEGLKGSLGSFVPFTVTKDFLYYVEVYGTEQRLYRVNLEGTPVIREIQTPLTGTIVPIEDSPVKPGLRIFVMSWIQPPVLYNYDASGNKVSETGFHYAPSSNVSNNLELEETYVKSYDGTLVPLSIIKPKNLKKDGSHPAIIFGYGNYGFSLNPFFDPMLPVFAKNGVIKAVAHVRGGGEFGEEWRLGGFKSTKSNTWKDAIACAEYMIKEGYTQPSKLVIQGESAGGILCGRAMTERPDLFAVAIPQVGALNTLRFEFTPNGPSHIPEFGTVKNEEDFKNLHEMDSYMHIKDGVNYPATLITAGLNDPRVIVWQPGKFAARLQAATASGKPVWLRIDMEGGHGQGNTKFQQFSEVADILAFILWQTSNKN